MTSRRAALTLVELLVVLAIISLMVGLLLPAVLSARRSARDTVCKNNLHQMALSLAQLHQLHNRIPEPPQPGYSGGWSFEILDFIEERNLHSTVGKARPLSSVPEVAYSRPVPMRCPVSPVTVSEVPPLDASHFVLVPINGRRSWYLLDAPLSSRHPWISGPEYEWNALLEFEGPHRGAFHKASSDGAVELQRPNHSGDP